MSMGEVRLMVLRHIKVFAYTGSSKNTVCQHFFSMSCFCQGCVSSQRASLIPGMNSLLQNLVTRMALKGV